MCVVYYYYILFEITLMTLWCDDIYEVIDGLITGNWMTAYANKTHIPIAARHDTYATQAHTHTQWHTHTHMCDTHV